MPQDVVVFFVHGINVSNESYFKPLEDGIRAQLSPETRQYLTCYPIRWADIVRKRQTDFIQYGIDSGMLDPHQLHRMVIQGLGDAAAYQKTEARDNSAYYKIQSRIRETIGDVVANAHDNRPVIMIGHSLGCHIISSYTWDLNRYKYGDPSTAAEKVDDDTRRFVQRLPNASPFERLDTFAGFITMGSNMPLFTFTFGPQRVFPITYAGNGGAPAAFPGASLDPSTRAAARWLNYYSFNDPLGYPLKPLNEAYENEKLLEDIETCSEGALRRRLLIGRLRQLNSFAAHVGYWTDRRVAAGAAGLIDKLIHAHENAYEVALNRPLFPHPDQAGA